MKWILILLLLSTVHISNGKYQLIFPGGDTFSYAKLYGTIDRPLNDFTLCHWSRTNVNKELDAAIFSYASEGRGDLQYDNSIVILVNHNKLVIHFRRRISYTDFKTNTPNNNWIHICETWSITGSSWQIFINGERPGYGNWTPDEPVRPNGCVILGQEQDEVGGKFDIKQSLSGQLSELHMWDYVLRPDQILQMRNCKNAHGGNIIDWNGATWALYNGTRISPVDLPCGQPQYNFIEY